MNKKYNLKIQLRGKRHTPHRSYVLDSLNRKQTILKEDTIKEDVEWCQVSDGKPSKVVFSLQSNISEMKQYTI